MKVNKSFTRVDKGSFPLRPFPLTFALPAPAKRSLFLTPITLRLRGKIGDCNGNRPLGGPSLRAERNFSLSFSN